MNSDILTSTFMRLRSRLKASATRLLTYDSDAEDALQETFCRLWQRRATIEDPSQAEGLSIIAVRNTCIDNLRRKQPVTSSVDMMADIIAEDDNDRENLYDAVKSIIDTKLSEREKVVIKMHDIQGYDYDEIADELGITETNARMIVSRARKAVRQIYLSSIKD